MDEQNMNEQNMNEQNMNGMNYGTNYGPNYGNMNGYENWQQPNQKKEGIGFGVASLVLGIISILLFCTCVNWITGILAIIFGIIQLVQYREKGLAIGGIITAGLSMVFTIAMYICISLVITDFGYENFYDYYENEYYYEDEYYDEYYDDEYYDDEYFEDEYYDEYYHDEYDDNHYDYEHDRDYHDHVNYDGERDNEFLNGSCI